MPQNEWCFKDLRVIFSQTTSSSANMISLDLDFQTKQVILFDS